MIRSLFAVACFACSALCAGQINTPSAAQTAGPDVIARCVEEAKAAAGKVEFTIHRAEAWQAVAQVQFRTGDFKAMRRSFAEARRVISGYDDLWFRPQAYEELAWRQWRCGEKSEARLTLARAASETGGISSVRPRFFWTYRIATDQSQMNDPAAAEVTWNVARTMKRNGSELDSFDVGSYAASLARAWKIDEARSVAAEIKDDLGSSTAWEGIAQAYLNLGDLKSAEAVIPKMERLDAARITAKIAEAQIRAGDTRGAKVLTSSHHNDLYESEAWVDVVQQRLKANDVAGAVTAAESISEPQDRVTALAAIVAQLVKQNDPATAHKLATQAAHDAQQVDFPDHMADAFSSVAKAQSTAGDHDGATESLQRLRREAEKLDEKDWRTDAPRKWHMIAMIATTQADIGDFQAAENTIAQMQFDDNDRERATATRSIATLIARTNGYPEAARWSQTLTPEMVRCYAWVGVAEGLLDRK